MEKERPKVNTKNIESKYRSGTLGAPRALGARREKEHQE
jgi:hypothetical protein